MKHVWLPTFAQIFHVPTSYFFTSLFRFVSQFNPLNAELNPICHLPVLLGDLKFTGPCVVSIFHYTCISNKMQRYTVYLYLETALHVSGGISTHHQEQHSTLKPVPTLPR
jgi:hypothetical protein